MASTAPRTLGHVHYDGGIGKNDEVSFLVRQDDCNLINRNKYVKVLCKGALAKQFIGRISDGPFYVPEELSRDSALSQTSILYGQTFPHVPPFFGLARVQLVGEYSDGRLLSLVDRPDPQARVVELSAEEIKQLLLPGEGAEMLWGSLSGYSAVRVEMSASDKRLLPRNVGIFGTVGSGKTNSSQVFIEEALKAGYAVVVIDVEGEYVAMNDGSCESHLEATLNDYGLTPLGVSDFHVYHPANTEATTGISKRFSIRTSEIDILHLAELIESTEAQERRLFEVMEEVKDRFKDESATRPPRKGDLADMLSSRGKMSWDLKTIISWAKKKAEDAKGADKHSFYALIGKLNRLDRTGAFDEPGVPSLNMTEMIKPGRLSVLDVSDCYNDALKNIIIFTTLRKVFDHKLNPDNQLIRTLVVIEEAHSFISRDKAKSMQETLDVLREIARRGRKRWLGLCFVSQQPSHLPPEVFELCNTRIIHNLKSKPNIDAVRLTSGGVSEDIWQTVATLSTGQAVVTSPVLRNPVVMHFRPSSSKRRFTD